jgi:anhydro-N-acetylmuramic acid kinase
MRALGLMSGTSADGVSVALASFNNRAFHLEAFETYPYPKKLREKVLNALNLKTPELAHLSAELGEFFAEGALRLIRKRKLNPRKIHVIASHGQTVYHSPNHRFPVTLQLGDSSVIAERTRISTVSDFRSLDIAAGGEGAPLIPFFDEYFFGGGPVRALQNIGGIANVTLVGKGIKTLAFDTGPGNCLMDLLVERMTRGKENFDREGRLARRGQIRHDWIRKFWRHPYFKRKPPKSTGRELFNLDFLKKVCGSSVTQKPLDVLASLNFFTAFSIFEGIRLFSPRNPKEVIVSGGGIKNRTLMTHLTNLFAPIPVRSIENFGIPTQAKEPLAFAFFGLRTLEKKVNHLPETTGARKAHVLGQLIHV